VAPLNSGRELLGAAVGYALTCAGRVAPPLLGQPTPCRGWDLAALLDHLCDSVAVLHRAVAAGEVADSAPPGSAPPNPAPPDCAPAGPEPTDPGDPVAPLRAGAGRMLAAWAAAGTAERLVVVGDRELTASMIALTGAIEITVHGWDISVACGSPRPVPLGLAIVLLPLAPLLVTAGNRPGLFADPVTVPDLACPGDQLVAFLGRRPHAPIAPAPG
jgi:uncharacterized protein (TIGR03086 family)